FPEVRDFVDTPVYDRYALAQGLEIQGPAIIEEDESTTVVPPGDRVEVSAGGSLVIHLSEGSAALARMPAAVSLADEIARLEADPIGLEIMWSRLISI